MKIVLMSAIPPPIGGIATWTLRMLQMNELPNDCEYILVDTKMIGGRDMFGNNRRRLMDEVRRSYGIWSNLKKTLVNSDSRIVHSCIHSGTLPMIREYVSACITKRLDRKFIIHFHCTVPNTKDGIFWKFLLKKICKKSDCVFVLNEQSRNYLSTITTTRIETLPNFVESSELVNDRTINNKIETVLYVGGVVESKGVLDIIETAKKCPDISFRLVGNSEKHVEQVAKDVQNVCLVGPLNKENVKKEMLNADVFMFLSKFPAEGFSVALLEAMASGLPCIVTDWAANKDMISNEGGFTVSDVNPDTILHCLETMQNKEVRKTFSERNTHIVKKKYIADVLFDQYTRIYKSLW